MPNSPDDAPRGRNPLERLPLPRGDGDERKHPPGWRVEGHSDGDKKPGGPRRALGPRFVVLLVVLLAVNYWAASRVTHANPRVRVPYSPFFIAQVNAGDVKQINSRGTAIQGTFRRKLRYPPTDKKAELTDRFKTEVPAFANTDQLSALLQRKNVVVNAEPPDQGPSLLGQLLLGFGPTILIVALFVWFARRAARQGGGGLMSFGRSRARRSEGGEQRVTFDDVAGIDDAKAELTEVVDFLRTPEKYRRLGGRVPRGVLLAGPPGTGKTLLARAVAGEAGVPFFSMSASEFVEMIVGVGASRVRDLFEQAKQAAPAIIFIDELDAIGRSRSAGAAFGGANDEREQTLNQILTAMDGFDQNTSVIVLAATNRPEILDPALLRPGRFDRRVIVQPPDQVGRRAILAVHTRSVPLADDIDLDTIASATPGMVGADLANLANEAALLAARRGHDRVQQSDLTDALEKIVLGAERKVLMSPQDRARTAYHEAGHAIVGMLSPGADPVRKVSIIPRGMALGVTLATPSADRFSYDRRYLITRIKVALGGRVAEELVYGEITTGAESDIQQLTGIARQMVGRWGMSPAIGPVAVLPQDGQGPLLPGVSETSEETQRVVDAEVRRIVEAAHGEVSALLRSNRDKLDSLSRALLEHETLDEADVYAAAGVPRPTREEEALARDSTVLVSDQTSV